MVPRELVPPLLGWLGRFHAAFWPSSSSSAVGLARSDGLWEAGTHMMLGKRPPGELGPLADIMSAFAAAFEAEDLIYYLLISFYITSLFYLFRI